MPRNRTWLLTSLVVLMASIFGARPTAAQGSGPLSAGIEAYNEQDYTSAFRLLSRAADAGESYAHYIIGMMYQAGLGVREDPAAARRHLRIAAAEGEQDARLALASMYLQGAGGPADPHGAVRLYRDAAADGSHDASYNLGVLYLGKSGIPADSAEAFRWFSESANANAQYNRGYMLFFGMGVERDRGKGLYQMCIASSREDGSEMARRYLEQLRADYPVSCDQINRDYPPGAVGPNRVASPAELQRHVSRLLHMAGSNFREVRGEKMVSRDDDVRSTYPIGSGTSFVRKFDNSGFVGHITRELALDGIDPSDQELRSRVPRWGNIDDARNLIQVDHLEAAIDGIIPRGWIKNEQKDRRSIIWKECEGARGHAVYLSWHEDEPGITGEWAGGLPGMDVGRYPTPCPGTPNLPPRR